MRGGEGGGEGGAGETKEARRVGSSSPTLSMTSSPAAFGGGALLATLTRTRRLRLRFLMRGAAVLVFVTRVSPRDVRSSRRCTAARRATTLTTHAAVMDRAARCVSAERSALESGVSVVAPLVVTGKVERAAEVLIILPVCHLFSNRFFQQRFSYNTCRPDTVSNQGNYSYSDRYCMGTRPVLPHSCYWINFFSCSLRAWMRDVWKCTHGGAEIGKKRRHD